MIRKKESSSDSPTAHEQVYRRLRNEIMNGAMPPGQALTLRGVAADFGFSITPVREAVRRLCAEGALSLSQSGRVSTPEPNNDRIEELAALRALLEPELSSRALPRAHTVLIDRMEALNDTIDQSIIDNDAAGYVRLNLEFHRSLYLRAQAPAMLAMVETVWLQSGPTMRQLYGNKQRQLASINHRKILAALRAGDEPSLRLAVREDVMNGLRMVF